MHITKPDRRICASLPDSGSTRLLLDVGSSDRCRVTVAWRLDTKKVTAANHRAHQLREGARRLIARLPSWIPRPTFTEPELVRSGGNYVACRLDFDVGLHTARLVKRAACRIFDGEAVVVAGLLGE